MRLISLLAGLLMLSMQLPAQVQTKVACVGNSITYGAGVANREKNSYPAQLQVYLGDKYRVENFGQNGATAVNRGDHPYTRTEVYRQSLDFNPDIVLIKLGTNDSKPQNMKHLKQFKNDYRRLVQTYKDLPSHPRVILLTPLKSYLPDESSISDKRCRDILTPLIRELAEEEKVECIDMYAVLGETWDAALLPDRLHPSSLGDSRMAEHLYHYLKPEGYIANPCVRPVCGAEYRSGAGWKEGADWHSVSEEITALLAGKQVDILFLGNSITQGFGGDRKLVTYKPGKAAADSLFAGMTWESAGISGDRTENLLWRLKHGGYAKANPRYVVIAIGVNNIVTAGHGAAQIAEGIRAVTREAAKQFPHAHILLQGLLPTGMQPTGKARLTCDSIHALLAREDWGRVKYANPSRRFLEKDGKLKAGLYSGDGIHLTPAGYLAWCQEIKEAFWGGAAARFALSPASAFDFHGFQGWQYRENGTDYKIVCPRRSAPGNPWVWRARFWGHEPQTDIALLEKGFHVAYCEVGDLYGSPKAVKRWERFYELATQAGLSRKPALEGMSRGGLIVYNWAAAHPDKVSCIYADAPVMDIKSWPMGVRKGKRSDEDVKRLLDAYGFASEKEAKRWKHNPIDHAGILAEWAIPMLHVVGDADTVVPVKCNTEVFGKRLRKLGARLEVIHKPGVGHHPHSLEDPTPIVDFILKANAAR